MSILLQCLRKVLIASLPLSLFADITLLPSQEPFVAPLEPTPIVKPYRSPTVAALLSTLGPGLGHYYLGDPRVGTELLGSYLVGSIGAFAARNDASLYATTISTLGGISLYSIYAAYRDAHLYNGNPPLALPRENLENLAKAPFQWSIIKKPEVWGACIGALALGTTLTYYVYVNSPCAAFKTTYIEPLRAFPVAIGEESLFRGLLQTSLSDNLSPWGAITLSSLLFGAAHIPNALQFEPSKRWRYYSFSVPFITCLGAYMGWLTHKNHSLKESVALHTWYDFVLMGAGALASQAMIGGKTDVSYGWYF